MLFCKLVGKGTRDGRKKKKKETELWCAVFATLYNRERERGRGDVMLPAAFLATHTHSFAPLSIAAAPKSI